MKTAGLLTATRIAQAALTATAAQHDIWLSDDLGVRGIGRLLLRVSPCGVKRFYFRTSTEGKRNTVALGPYSRTRQDRFLTLEQAREAARGCAQVPADSVQRAAPLVPMPSVATPTAAVPQSTHATISSSPLPTVMDLCKAYVARLRAQHKTCARNTETTFLRYIEPTALASTPARDATSDQFAAILRDIVKAGHGTTARRLRSQLHSTFANAMRAKFDPFATEFTVDPGVEVNPITKIPSMAWFNKPGDRALSRAELTEFWRYLQDDGKAPPTMAHRAVRLSILLFGQRCQQLLRAQIKDVDLERGEVLLLDGKGMRTTAREHLLPGGPVATEELRWLVQHARDLGVTTLFPSTHHDKRINEGSVSHCVRDASVELLRLGRISSSFSYRDLRRTIETHGSALISKEIRAHLQSHDLGGIQNRNYNRYDFRLEKRDALVVWEGFLASLLSPTALAATSTGAAT